VNERFNVTSYFLDRNLDEGRGGRTALCCGDLRYSFADLARLSNRVGHVLTGLGVRPEERVLLALSDGPEFVATWYAVLKVGAVAAEVYTFLPPEDYAYYLNYSRARVVVADGTTLTKIRAVAGECPHLRHILAVGAGAVGAGPAPGPTEHDFAALTAQAPDHLDPADTTRDHPALWKFTTGSTGAPKAAVHCHGDPLISFEGYARGVLGLTASDVVLPVPKLFFGYARDLAALFNFGVGAAGVVFPERATPERLFGLIKRHRPTILVQVPTMMAAMLSHPTAQEQDLSSIRLCTSAGEALPKEIYRRWLARFGGEVLDGIGSSEVYHIYISNRPGQARAGSVGQLVPGYDARVAGPEGTPTPDGEPGELWVRGESSALLYWNARAKSRRTFAGEWVRTGDIFTRDAEGFFYYQGRTNDLLKVGGIWVAPLEIENCLRQHAQVADCAVVGHEAETGLIVPRAFVVPTPDTAPTDDLAAQLQAFVKANLSPHKRPRLVTFLPDLPRTASGKVDRKALSGGGLI
jgi:benzoate-CoA ligase family protein